MRSPPSPPSGLSRQTGSVLVNAAVGLLAMIVLLSVIDLGFAYFYKREYQKTADLAALAGAQQLRSGCAAALAAATENADSNQGGIDATTTPACGTWDPALDDRFVPATDNANAVQTVVLGAAPRFLPFLGEQNLSATAVATVGDPVAAFSVGTRTGRVDGGVLGEVLAVPGLNLDGTTLLAYDGLANVNITPGGLLEELGIPVTAGIGVGGFNALLAAEEVTLGELLDATATVAGQSGLLSVNADLVNALELAAGLSDLEVRLGSDADNSGLFTEIIAPDEELSSGLQTQVSALQIVNAAIGVATSEHAIDVPDLSLNLLGLASVETQVALIEPPSIAIGGLGANAICDADEDCPQAYNAQVRAFVHVKTESGLLGGLLSPLLKLDLPIVLDVTTAQGELQELCTTDLEDDGDQRAAIDVNASVLRVCVGEIDEADLFSRSDACDASLQSMELLNVAGLITLPNNSLQIDGLESNAEVILAEGETDTVGNNLEIGSTVSNLVSELNDLLFGGLLPEEQLSAAELDTLAEEIYLDTADVCSENTGACRAQRLAAARARIEADIAASGLLSGVIGGLFDLLTGVANPCSGLLFLGGSDDGCTEMIRGTLESTSNASAGGLVSNALAVLVGTLQPILDALGSSVLRPLLEGLVGLTLGETDVELQSLNCGGNARLVE
ncbi:MAG: TadG family pilus assembly protein [Panacagrimonas sp.]